MSDKIVLNLTINLTLDEAYMTAGTISAVLEGMKHAAEENGVPFEGQNQIQALLDKFVAQIPGNPSQMPGAEPGTILVKEES